MRISFIRPNFAAMRSRDAMEPLCFAILRSLTPPEVETVLHDERLAPLPDDDRPDLVAMTVETHTARRAYEIAAGYRRRGIPVVMGGYQPTLLPEEAAAHADALVQGDAENLWPAVLADARAGRLARLYRSDDPPPLDGPPPDRSIFAGKRYAPVALAQFGRGCRFACDFCSIRAFYGSRLRQRPIADFVRELASLRGRHVFIVDDNLFVDVPRTRALLQALVPLGITWSCQVSIDIVRQPELMALLRRSGCTTALIGFESLDATSLGQMGKGWNLRHGGYDHAVARFREAGIMLYGTFVFGYDGDTPRAFDEAVAFAQRHRFYLANFNPLTPTPGTPLLARLRAEARLLHDKWWLAPDYRYGQATFHPRGMSAAELAEGCWRARSAFYAPGSIARRFLDPPHLHSPRRVAIYLLSNLISRREIRRKQGRRLGGAELGGTELARAESGRAMVNSTTRTDVTRGVAKTRAEVTAA